MVAALVIRIGRSRVMAASRTAYSLGWPCSCSRLAKLHDQDSLLGHQPDQSYKAYLGVNIESGGQASGPKGTFGSGIFRKLKINAPNMAGGTDPARMTKGSRTLLNCAASTRNMDYYGWEA